MAFNLNDDVIISQQVKPDHKPCSELVRMGDEGIRIMKEIWWTTPHIHETFSVADCLERKDCSICGVLVSLILRHPDYCQDWRLRTIRVYWPAGEISFRLVVLRKAMMFVTFVQEKRGGDYI